MQTLLNASLLDYLRENLVLTIILAVIAAAIIALVIALAVNIAKGKKEAKEQKVPAEKPAKEPEPEQPPVEPEPQPEPEPEPEPKEENITEENTMSEQKKTTEKKEPTIKFVPVAKKPEPKKAQPAKKPEPAKKAEPAKVSAANGKWVIENVKGKFWLSLVAPNGQVMLESPTAYASLSSAKSGIKTYQENIAAGKLEVTELKNGDSQVQILNGSGRLLATSSTYSSKAQTENALSSIKRWAPTKAVEVIEK